ncbi:YeiH family protein [Bradyrhizobium sp.]|uniref:YeiH family protein n=1 Tax=Bradyrhizobium sp. TaxID=376 RepID=UPI002CB65E0D|nr:putative sulfate exporter family transporter [Bradyrhizobium sp.]HWX62229.1 putative sulfate exporter family transporter [Bradyrhizobium sp.]
MSGPSSSVRPLPSRLIELIAARLPGVLLCAGVTALALTAQALELRGLGHPYVEALVLAILFGAVLRAVWTPVLGFQAGIAFSAKQLLELAVMLLGASLDLTLVTKSGLALLVVIVAVVLASLGASYGVSRMLGLPNKLAILVACGNSICGNSAIAAVAPVIGAGSADVGAAISFTAILGVLTVIGLPLLVSLVGLTATQYGILAGLTVYAVPQVLAATLPVGLVATQMGTFVKLGRVLLLGPVVVALSLLFRKQTRARDDSGGGSALASLTWVPWFVPAFLALAGLRSAGLIPQGLTQPIATAAAVLTIISMAALGLNVDLRLLARIGARVTAAVTLSLAFLIAISLVVVRPF